MTDAIRTRIAQLLHEKGITMSAASRTMGRNHAYLQQFLKRGSPRHLDRDAAAALAALLEVPAESLLPERPQRPLPAGNAVPIAAPPPQSVSTGLLPRNVPVLGATVGGGAGGGDAYAPEGSDRGDFLLNGQVVDHVRRPPAMEAVPAAFALYVQGESMWPWRAPGSLVYVHPARPPHLGDHVVVELHPEREEGERPCYVKRFLGRSGSSLRLGQYNPPREDIEIPLARVRCLYRVMEWEELLGL